MVERDEPRVIASGLVKKNGKYMMIYCPKFEAWRAPGGRIDFGERAEEAVVREIKEELGIVVKVLRFLGFGQDGMLIRKKCDTWRTILFFECEYVSGEITPDPKEVSEYKWVTLEELKTYPNVEGALLDLFKRFGTPSE